MKRHLLFVLLVPLAVVLFTGIIVSLGRDSDHDGIASAFVRAKAQDQNRQPYTGHEDHSISVSDAAALTRNFRNSTDAVGTLRAEYFGRDAIQAILDQPGCVGMRIYNGKRDDNVPVFVLVGVDAQGQDMTGGQIDEIGFPCPPFCDTVHVLDGSSPGSLVHQLY